MHSGEEQQREDDFCSECVEDEMCRLRGVDAFGGVRHVEQVRSLAHQPDGKRSGEVVGDGAQGLDEVEPAVGMVGELGECVVGALLVVFSLEVEAEVGGVRKEFRVDGEGGIGHGVGRRREWPSAFAEVAVGEGEREL